MSAVTSGSRPPTSSAAHIHGRYWDFVLLGGGSLFLLLAMRLSLWNAPDAKEWSLAVTLALANIINHPHFAHSYQIFYRNFGEKLTSYPAELRLRYLLSGIVVPAGLVAFFAGAIWLEAPRALGIAANLMFFLVGWHYVKQGYGMAMVDAVLKRAFYSDPEKKALLRNCYSTWIFSWLLVNYFMANTAQHYFGIGYFVLPIPFALVVTAGATCLLTTILVGYKLRLRSISGKPIAWNGVIAYSVSLYAWLLIRDPIVLLWVPLFHSLQYLAVVWRYETNRIASENSKIRPSLRMVTFTAAGLLLGYMGFWLLPGWLDSHAPYSKEVFGASLFMFMFWIFINVHHYFLDTVMWRKGNPDVQKHLFSHHT